MRLCRAFPAVVCAFMILIPAPPSHAQNIDAQEYWLDNGMQILMVERHEAPTITGAIIARVGSANETTGITGISHLFEHMMFKGTKVIGTRDIERDLEIMAELDSLRALIRVEEEIMREKSRRGEIAGMNDPDAKTERYRKLEAEFDSLIVEQRELIVKDELNQLYSKHGGTFVNAFTSNDMTGYFARVPKNKIELFMWLESDRFSDPVFREFYSERDVVREERRLGYESTPTGLIEEEFEAMFWKSSSYRWMVMGWPSDVENITREQADAYFDTYYAPNNLTMILVGDFESAEMLELAEKYFGRIPRGETDPPDVITVEEKQYGERRLIAEAETSPEAQIWYHTVAWRHPDSYALDVLAGLLNGKTGRLYKKLVEEKGIAKSSSAGGSRMMGGDRLQVLASQDSRKYAGAFMIGAEGVSGVKAEELEQAIYEVLEELKQMPVPEHELRKVKNQIRVQTIRFLDVMSGMGIIFYLGMNAAMGDWTEANNQPAMIEKVTAEDIQRVANKYFSKDQRNVLIINTKKSPGDQSEPEEDSRFAQAVVMIKSADDAQQLEQMIGMFSMGMDKVEDPEQRARMEELIGIASERLKELKSAESN